MGAFIALVQPQPFGAQLFAARPEAAAKCSYDSVRHKEFRVLWPTVERLVALHLLRSQRLAMSGRCVLPVWRTVADVAFDDDQGRAVGGPLGIGDRVGDPHAVVGVADPQHLPAIAKKPRGDILAERELGMASIVMWLLS